MRILKDIVYKTAAVLILLTVALSGVQVFANSEIINFDEQFAVLAGLNLIAADEESYSDMKITRARFAKELTAFLGIKCNGRDNQYYYDVDKKNEYKNYINTVREYGYMIGENGYFRPDDLITKTEIIKTVVSAIGCTELAEYYGGYKEGYLKIASDFDISDGLTNSDSNATYSDMIRIFYNTLDVEIISLKFFGGEVSYEQSGITFLEKFHGLSEDDGRVTGTFLATLDGEECLGKKSVRIDGIAYELSDDVGSMESYLGYYISFWYNENNEIVYFCDNETEEIVITEDEYENYASNIIYYLDDIKSKKAKISKDASVLYNGADVTSYGYSDDIFDISIGSIELIKKKNSSEYDVIKIYEYKNYVVSSVSEKESEIYVKGRDKKISLEDYKVYYLQGTNGEEKKLSDISENNILSIGESKDKNILYLIVSNKTVIGNITQTGTDDSGKSTVTINNEQIAVYEDFKLNSSLELVPGIEITAYLDYKGNIAYASYTANAFEWKYGYMIKVYEDGYECGIKLYSSDGKFKTYSMPEKISLDGIRMLSTKAVADLNGMGGGKVIPQLIKYIAVGENVTHIDTAKPAEFEKSEKNLSLYVDTKLRYSNENQRFHYYGSDYAWSDYFTSLKADDNTIVFVVPKDLEDQRTNQSLYSIYMGSDYFRRSSEPIYNIAAYDVDEDNGDIAKIIVVKGGAENDYDDRILVQALEKEVNSNDEIVTVLKGYSYKGGTNLESWEIDSNVDTISVHYNKTVTNGEGMNVEFLETPIENLKRGDIVMVSTGPDGKISGIRRLFGLSHLETSMQILDNEGNLTNKTVNDTFIQKHGVISIGGIHIGSGGGSERTDMIGVLTDRNGKYLHMANLNPKTNAVNGRGKITIELNGYPVMHYNSKINKIEVLSQNEIDAYLYLTNRNAICYTFTTYTNLRFMVIYD